MEAEIIGGTPFEEYRLRILKEQQQKLDEFFKEQVTLILEKMRVLLEKKDAEQAALKVEK